MARRPVAVMPSPKFHVQPAASVASAATVIVAPDRIRLNSAAGSAKAVTWWETELALTTLETVNVTVYVSGVAYPEKDDIAT